jgi:hypothetical protein
MTRCLRTGVCASIITAANSHPGDGTHNFHFHTTVPVSNWLDMCHTLAIIVIAVTCAWLAWNTTSKPEKAPKAPKAQEVPKEENKVGVDASTATDPCRYDPPPLPFSLQQFRGVPKAPPAWAAPLPPPPDMTMAWAGLAYVYVTELGDCAHFSQDCEHLSNKYALRKRLCRNCARPVIAGVVLPSDITEIFVTERYEIAHMTTKCGTLSTKYVIRKRICPQCGQQKRRAGK